MLAIVDYGSGNLRSVAKAFERVADGKNIRVTGDAKLLAGASHIVLPGVGAFGDCMQGLAALPGMLDALSEEVLQRKKYFLGICVGMQLLFDCGHEHGKHKGLGWLKGDVVPLVASGKWQVVSKEEKETLPLATCHLPLKIPHMGWNELHMETSHPLMEGIENGAHAYFVHSYHCLCKNGSDVVAITTYGQSIAAVVGREHIMGTQFHPEKSQETGLKLLKNFLNM